MFKKFESRLSLVFSLILALAAPLYSQTYPPARSDFTWRVANRKQVSHILYENRGGVNTVTLLMTHPRYWSFHAPSHPLHRPCGTHRDCLALLEKLNRFLDRGWNLRLRLHGSLIRDIEFLEP